MAALTRPEDTHQAFERSFNDGDVEGLMALYMPDATLVPQPGQTVSGHAAIREALQGFLALKGKIEMETTYVVESGDVALLRSSWRLTGTGADGQPLAMAAKSNEVVRRQPDGRWLIAIDHPYGSE
jgi:uncharacterized protein (TIGR02246 family)